MSLLEKQKKRTHINNYFSAEKMVISEVPEGSID